MRHVTLNHFCKDSDTKDNLQFAKTRTVFKMLMKPLKWDWRIRILKYKWNFKGKTKHDHEHPVVIIYCELKAREVRGSQGEQRDQTQRMWGFADGVLKLKFWRYRTTGGRIRPQVILKGYIIVYTHTHTHTIKCGKAPALAHLALLST